jgi:hypothetical protein
MRLDRDHAALRDENDRLCEEKRQRDERKLAEWREQNAERKRVAAAALREARDWPEAFTKQETLIRQELAFDAGDGVDDYFANALAANGRAAVLFREKMAAVETLRRKLLDEVALQVEEEFCGRPGVTDLVERLRQDDPVGYLNW